MKLNETLIQTRSQYIESENRLISASVERIYGIIAIDFTELAKKGKFPTMATNVALVDNEHYYCARIFDMLSS